ncbi:MAG: 50S ribosomal protein L1 [Planctomycetota bacterium]|nr:50S ribosomal protein L1 [Planctomycetota bacterium]
MAKRSKRYRGISRKVDRAEEHDIVTGVEKVMGLANAKFNETIELAMCLNINTKDSSEQLRGSFSLPHGVGKSKSVVVFCAEDKVQEALDAGAVKAGLDDLAKEINDGWMDFDVAVATPDARRVVGKLGRVLGPRGLMPNPKSGTVGEDVEKMVKEFSAGKVEYRNDKTGNLHIVVGSSDIDKEKVADNVRAFMQHVLDKRPASVKGRFIKSAFLSPTMGPSVRLKPMSIN